MIDAQQRSVLWAVALGSVLSALLIAVWVAAAKAGGTAPAYRLEISAIAQAASRTRSIDALNAPMQQIRSWLETSRTDWTENTSESPAISPNGQPTQHWIAIAHFSVRSKKLAALHYVAQTIRRRSSWPVTDIDMGGEFTPVVVRPGVTQLRLSELVAEPHAGIRLQTSGPSVVFSVADVLAVCLIALVVLGFGAAERNARDVFAFPRGMHPVVVCCQVLTLGLFCCFVTSYVPMRGTGFQAGMCVLTAAIGINSGRWLWISASSWRRAPMPIFRAAIVAVSACLTVAGLVIAFG